VKSDQLWFHRLHKPGLEVVYYESIKRELKIKPTYECHCDARLQTKTKRFTGLSYTGFKWVGRGTGTPKDKDEVNKREVGECEG
jgi:hypothetical protein